MRAGWVLLLAISLTMAGCTTQEPAGPEDGAQGDQPDTGTQEPTDDTGDPGQDEAPEDDPGNETDGTGDGDQEPSGNTTDGTEDDEGPGLEVPMRVTSPAFDNGTPIPARFTDDGPDTSPELVVTDPPANATSLALIVDDPDAPTDEPWVHWLTWNLPAGNETRIPEGYPPTGNATPFDGAQQGANSFTEHNRRYRGPAPPHDDDPHTYRFTVYALDTSLDLAGGADRGQLDEAMDGHVIERATLTGTYDR